VAEHAVRVVGADQHQAEAARTFGDRQQFDVARLGHRARVERGDLAQIVIGGADEPRGVRDLRDVHTRGVHAVSFQPGPVVLEVRTDRSDQNRPHTQHTEPERHVRTDPAAPDHEIVGEEGQRHAMQLLGDELLGESAREVHEMVGCDAAGHCDTGPGCHRYSPILSATSSRTSYLTRWRDPTNTTDR